MLTRRHQCATQDDQGTPRVHVYGLVVRGAPTARSRQAAQDPSFRELEKDGTGQILSDPGAQSQRLSRAGQAFLVKEKDQLDDLLVSEEVRGTSACLSAEIGHRPRLACIAQRDTRGEF